ncbi:hypothetical protein Ade02nite_19470 [Paractinoplanes deccanensis]|uniref:Uncharacterized protein n=1 Tax=Paractinoplanes deccanensis TaxID=113561 RepID=A0ABQ3XZX8_9ACTN|nr:hypothetical protein Ade02nite_19470 [Actinoplanes deccanensis]
MAEENLAAFVDAATELGLRLADEPLRVAEADRGGRYGWDLPLEGGTTVRVLMPGRPIAELKDLSVQAPTIFVNGSAWWWNDAVNQAVPLEPGR